ncbi:MAG: DUF434 domain-containing protein [Pirellulales bacterium]|nr:DUF434 domain-containing protein [Pirellulales bacterium]
MPDRRTHRGPHPGDARLFGPEAVDSLSRAATDLAWLLDRDYPATSSLKLVGDRYRLVARQRTAVARCTCSASQRDARLSRQVEQDALEGRTLWIDGYNVMTTVEAALAGGVILSARDGAYRDMASMHGSYRKVAETLPAVECLGRTLAEFRPASCVWYLDQPVSNSGRLKTILLDAAQAAGWPWQVELVPDPDRILIAAADALVATADSAVLDACSSWFNLARATVERCVPDATMIELSAPA